MKHAFKKPLLAATLCVVGMGMAYSAFADMYIKPEYRAAYAANPDNPNLHESRGGDGILTAPLTFPELPTETSIALSEDDPVVDFNEMCGGNDTDEEGSAIGGVSMAGLLEVTFQYDDGSSSGPMIWGEGTLPNGVEDGVYELTHTGDTFQNPWRLQLVNNPVEIKVIVIIIIRGRLMPTPINHGGEWTSIAFDIYYNPEMTPGSGHGEPFASVAYPEHIQQPVGEYSIPVSFEGIWYEDLYHQLLIQIPGGWDGSGGDFFAFVAFLADTDCIAKALDVVELKTSANLGGVQLSWADESPGKGVGAYVVFRTTEGNYRSCVAGGKCKDPEMTTVYTTSYMDNTAKPGKSYRYAVLELEGNETPADALAVLRQKYSEGTLAITEAITP
jgi:hypothetical protein